MLSLLTSRSRRTPAKLRRVRFRAQIASRNTINSCASKKKSKMPRVILVVRLSVSAPTAVDETVFRVPALVGLYLQRTGEPNEVGTLTPLSEVSVPQVSNEKP